MYEEVSMDLTPTVIPVTLGGEKYELREASGAASVKYKNAVMSGMVLGPDGKPTSAKNLADTEPFLVSLCLFKIGSEKPVELATVLSWPSRVQKRLYKLVKEISDLDETKATDDAAKKEPSTSTDG